MGSSITHVAGPSITIAGRVIQRCSICGYKLCDSLNASMPLNPDGTVPKFPVWEPGRQIRVNDDGNPISYILLPDSDTLEDDSCLSLVE